MELNLLILSLLSVFVAVSALKQGECEGKYLNLFLKCLINTLKNLYDDSSLLEM